MKYNTRATITEQVMKDEASSKLSIDSSNLNNNQTPERKSAIIRLKIGIMLALQ